MQQNQNPWWKKFSIQQLFSRGSEFRRDARLSWQGILILFFVGSVVALGLGYFTYYRALHVEDESIAPTAVRSALRAGEVKSVIDIYQGRKERFTSLLADKPTFLSPLKGSVLQTQDEDPVVLPETSTSSTVLP